MLIRVIKYDIFVLKVNVRTVSDKHVNTLPLKSIDGE